MAKSAGGAGRSGRGFKVGQNVTAQIQQTSMTGEPRGMRTITGRIGGFDTSSTGQRLVRVDFEGRKGRLDSRLALIENVRGS